MATKKSKLKVALYARISTYDQKTLKLQLTQIRKYVRDRGWSVGLAMGLKLSVEQQEVKKAS